MEYYTYVWCDPRTGPKTYGQWGFPGEPFYYGKGTGKRFLDKRRNSDVLAVVEQLNHVGLKPLIFTLDDETENDAHENEKYFISLIGRKDLGLGPLLNKTNGGEGFSGYKGKHGSWDHVNKSPNYRNSMQDKHHKESTLKLLSEKAKHGYETGRVNPMTGISPKSKGKHWYNNGLIELMSEFCPDKYTKGRLPKIKQQISNSVKKLHQEGIYV